jgi:hypothetical protein
MSLKVRNIKHVLQPDADIDPTAIVDVACIDALVYGCSLAAQETLSSALPPGFTEFERDQLKWVIDGQRYGHLTIRGLLQGKQNASAVDALTVARLQLEVLYSLCFMLQDAQNVRLFLKNGWKKKYIRFLLGREEHGHLPRYSEYFSTTAQPLMDRLQGLSSVTEGERRTIELDQLGASPGPPFTPTKIQRFPTPMRVIESSKGSQKQMLERLYPEYEYLCSFVHGDTEAVLFRAVSDPRSPLQREVSSEQAREFYQRYILEAPIFYSAIATIQAATEVAVIYPAQVDLLAQVTKAWATLVRVSVLAVPVWEIRTKALLPLLPV